MSEELNIDEQIAQIDADIAVQEKKVARAEALERMKKTDDYKLVFEEGYIGEEAKRVFGVLTDPRVTKPDDKTTYTNQLETIRSFSTYVGTDLYKGTVVITGLNAKKDIDTLVQTKEKLLSVRGV